MWGERARGSAPGPLGNQSRRFPPIAAMGPPLRYADLGADSPRPLAQREGRYSGGSPPLRATGARAAPSLPLACLEIQSRRFRCRSMPAGHRTAPPLRYEGHNQPRLRIGCPAGRRGILLESSDIRNSVMRGIQVTLPSWGHSAPGITAGANLGRWVSPTRSVTEFRRSCHPFSAPHRFSGVT
jgi:hypothetical protein